MAIPDGGLITETNQQYYAGAQGFISTNQDTFTFTFDTQLVLGNWDPANADYALNNFKLYGSTNGITYEEIIPGSAFAAYGPYTVTNPESGGSIVTLAINLPATQVLVCQMKTLTGGSFGNRDAYGITVEENYGSYSYTTLADVVNNFLVGYVGKDKLIPDVKRTDVIFHAKRALQEFSYDTLKSIKSQELNIPPSLSVVLPQDYVNYVRMSWIDQLGVQRIIYPANNLTDNPYTMPLQDNLGVPTQDNFGENTEGSSITEDRWKMLM